MDNTQCLDHSARMRALEDVVRQLATTDARQEERHSAVLARLDDLGSGVKALHDASARHEASLVVLVGDRERRTRITKRAVAIAVGGVAATVTAVFAKFGDVVFAQLAGR